MKLKQYVKTRYTLVVKVPFRFGVTTALLISCLSCGAFNRKENASTLITLTGIGVSNSASHQALQVANPVMQGGIMVYVQGADGTQFSGSYFLPNETVPVIAVVPNGKYLVYGIGYDLPNMGGNLYCGYGPTQASPIALSGVDKTVEITLTAQNLATNSPQSFCKDALFGVHSVVIGKCADGLNGQDIGDPNSSATFCTEPYSNPPYTLSSSFIDAQAVGVMIYPYEQRIGDTGSVLTPIPYRAQTADTFSGLGLSRCFPLSSNIAGAATSGVITLPSGLTGLSVGQIPPLSMKMRISALSGCGNTSGSTTINPLLISDFFSPFNLNTNFFREIGSNSTSQPTNFDVQFKSSITTANPSWLGLIL